MFSAAKFLVIFATIQPRLYAEDPERFAVVAVAAERAHELTLPSWRHGSKQLAGAITSAINTESHFDRDVHSGANNGNGNCLTQIHHTNKLWKRAGAPSFESLLGTDLQATTWCLHTAAITLVVGVNHCHKRRFFTYWQRAMWTMYATGRRCNPWSKTAGKRQRLQNRVAYGTWEPTEEHRALVAQVKEGTERE